MATYVYDEPRSVRCDGGVIEERQEERGEEVVSVDDEKGSGSQEDTLVLSISIQFNSIHII